MNQHDATQNYFTTIFLTFLEKKFLFITIIVLYYHELRLHDTNFSATPENSAKKCNYKANTTTKRNLKTFK